MSTNIVPLRTGGQIAPIIPTSIEEVFRLATAISKSGLAPNGIKSPEQITIAIMHGMEIGLPPMQAVNKIAVVNGKPTVWGDAVPALLYARGFKIKEWIDGETAFCTVTRPDGTAITRSFSKADAKTAGLLDKAGPWKQYPNRMLAMRARGYAARDGAADVLSGMYITEELDGGELKADEATHQHSLQVAPPEIPDIPDVEAVEPILDAEGYVAMVREQAAVVAGSDGDFTELQEAFGPDIQRLPEDYQAEMYDLLRMEPPQ